MHPTEQLFEATRNNNLSKIRELIASGVNCNATGNFNAEEVNILKQVSAGKMIIDEGVTTNVTALFVAILHHHEDAYNLLLSLGCDPKIKTATGLNILQFYLLTPKRDNDINFFSTIHKSCPSHFITDTVPLTMQPNLFEGLSGFFGNAPRNAATSRPHTPSYNNDFKSLDTLINAAKKGDLHTLNSCITAETHKKDTKGSALYYAVATGHDTCVESLLKAGVSVKAKHYFAAGQACNMSKDTSTKLYYLLQPIREHQPSINCPEVIKKGNLIETSAFLGKNNALDESLTTYLYFSLINGHILTSRLLLESGAKVVPKHYFAAGFFPFNTNDTDKDKKQKTATRLFELLKKFDIQENNIHSSTHYEVLGIEENAHDVTIRKSFRILSLKYHPDSRKETSNALHFQKISAAKDALLLSAERKSYWDKFYDEAEQQLYELCMKSSASPNTVGEKGNSPVRLNEGFYDPVSYLLIINPVIFPTKSAHLYDAETLGKIIEKATAEALEKAMSTGRATEVMVQCPLSRETATIELVQKAIERGSPHTRRLIEECCDSNPSHPDVVEWRKRKEEMSRSTMKKR